MVFVILIIELVLDLSQRYFQNISRLNKSYPSCKDVHFAYQAEMDCVLALEEIGNEQCFEETSKTRVFI